MRVRYEPATYEDLIEARELGWGGWEDWSVARLRYLPLLGYAARDEADALQGVGCVAWIGSRSDGMALGTFAITEEFRASPHSRWVHRRALEVLSVAHRAAPLIYAQLDTDIPQAREFIERLGFVDIGEWWVRDAGDPGSAESSRLVRTE